MPKFVATVEITDQTKRQEVRPKHLAYLQQLSAAGKLVVAGPLAGGGSLCIYEADSEDEARQMQANDPYAQAGIVRDARVRGWTQVFPEQAG